MDFRKIRVLLHHGTYRSALRGVSQYLWGRTGQRRVLGLRMYFKMRVEVLLRSETAIRTLAGRRVRVWVDDKAFPRIQKLIRRARHTIIIQMFIWKNDELGRRMAQCLIDAANTGVRVQVMKDAVGDLFESYKDFITTKNAPDAIWQRFWTHPNIRVRYGTYHDHAKVYIIDEKILLLTGMNIANEYDRRWHDYLVELRGRQFVDQYLTQGAAGRQMSDRVRVVMNVEERREIRPAVMEMIEGAQKSLIVEHPYVADSQVLEALIRKSHQGVRVTLILPARPDFHHYANMHSASELLARGARRFTQVLMYPTMLHGKIILADHKRALIGSANLMTSSLDHMGEVNVLLDGQPRGAIIKLHDVLRNDIQKSKQLDKAPWMFGLGKWLAWLQL